MESLNQALQYERGERDDLRVTVLAAQPKLKAKTALPKEKLKQGITNELEDLSKADLVQVANYVASLKVQHHAGTESPEKRVITAYRS
ncbi:MAG: hypothetical protein ACRD82_15000 [Blastocatellia bacterium]